MLGQDTQQTVTGGGASTGQDGEGSGCTCEGEAVSATRWAREQSQGPAHTQGSRSHVPAASYLGNACETGRAVTFRRADGLLQAVRKPLGLGLSVRLSLDQAGAVGMD